MQRTYFVSYSRISQSGGAFGFGNATLTLTGRMTADAFQQVNTAVKDQNPGYDVVILSFQELETAETTASV
jgi:DNA topoisomerase VI subunit B